MVLSELGHTQNEVRTMSRWPGERGAPPSRARAADGTNRGLPVLIDNARIVAMASTDSPPRLSCAFLPRHTYMEAANGAPKENAAGAHFRGRDRNCRLADRGLASEWDCHHYAAERKNSRLHRPHA